MIGTTELGMRLEDWILGEMNRRSEVLKLLTCFDSLLRHAWTVVPRECLLRYLCRRLGEPYRELTHSEIYERLVRIAGSGGRGMGQQRRKEDPAVF